MHRKPLAVAAMVLALSACGQGVASTEAQPGAPVGADPSAATTEAPQDVDPVEVVSVASSDAMDQSIPDGYVFVREDTAPGSTDTIRLYATEQYAIGVKDGTDLGPTIVIRASSTPVPVEQTEVLEPPADVDLQQVDPDVVEVLDATPGDVADVENILVNSDAGAVQIIGTDAAPAEIADTAEDLLAAAS